MAAILSPSMLAYEDDFLLIIDKPAGMLVHPTVSERGTTLYDYVKAYYEANGITAGIHPVSRLDRNTSGLVIFAKEPIVQHWLSQQQVEKEYLALACGRFENSEGIIEALSPARKAVSSNAVLTTRTANTPKQPTRFWQPTAAAHCSRSGFSPDARTRYACTLLPSAIRWSTTIFTAHPGPRPAMHCMPTAWPSSIRSAMCF